MKCEMMVVFKLLSQLKYEDVFEMVYSLDNFQKLISHVDQSWQFIQSSPECSCSPTEVTSQLSSGGSHVSVRCPLMS